MNIKRSIRRMVRNIRNKSLGFKIIAVSSALVVSASAFTIPKLFEQTHSAYESHAVVNQTGKNALFDLEVFKLDNIAANSFSGYDANNPTTFVPSGVTDGVSLGKTTIKDGSTSFGSLLDINDLKPGDTFAFGYKCQDVGTIPMTLYLDLKSSYQSPDLSATPELSYLGKDPRQRFDLKIFESDSANGTYTKISDGTLDLSMYDTVAAVPLVPNTRNLSPTQSKYYIFVVNFTNSTQTWTSNFTGDNIYQLAQTGLDITIKALQQQAQ